MGSRTADDADAKFQSKPYRFRRLQSPVTLRDSPSMRTFRHSPCVPGCMPCRALQEGPPTHIVIKSCQLSYDKMRA
jgi:hypothetical protein